MRRNSPKFPFWFLFNSNVFTSTTGHLICRCKKNRPEEPGRWDVMFATVILSLPERSPSEFAPYRLVADRSPIGNVEISIRPKRHSRRKGQPGAISVYRFYPSTRRIFPVLGVL